MKNDLFINEMLNELEEIHCNSCEGQFCGCTGCNIRQQILEVIEGDENC